MLFQIISHSDQIAEGVIIIRHYSKLDYKQKNMKVYKN